MQVIYTKIFGGVIYGFLSIVLAFISGVFGIIAVIGIIFMPYSLLFYLFYPRMFLRFLVRRTKKARKSTEILKETQVSADDELKTVKECFQSSIVEALKIIKEGFQKK